MTHRRPNHGFLRRSAKSTHDLIIFLILLVAGNHEIEQFEIHYHGDEIYGMLVRFAFVHLPDPDTDVPRIAIDV